MEAQEQIAADRIFGLLPADLRVALRSIWEEFEAAESPSARFARRREDQARMLFDKAAETLQERVETYTGNLTHLILGGDRLTLLGFEKRCPFLQRLDVVRLHRILNVERPSLNALNALPRQIYMSRVSTFVS